MSIGTQDDERAQQPDSEREVEADLDLDEAINALERVDWGAVPGVSAATAATFTAELVAARETLRDRGEE